MSLEKSIVLMENFYIENYHAGVQKKPSSRYVAHIHAHVVELSTSTIQHK